MPETASRKGVVLGLVGPVCSGKSEVARRLQQRGAEIYEADTVVRRLYEQQDVKQAVRVLFGDEVFDETGAVNRSAVAAKVFGSYGDPELLRALTDDVIFPRTGPIMRAEIGRFRQQAGLHDVLVLDAPTLLEAGRGDWCDSVLLVTAPLENRRTWAAARGWPAGEVERRDAALMPEAEKRRRAHFVIENATTLADLDAAVDRLWRQMQGSNGRTQDDSPKKT